MKEVNHLYIVNWNQSIIYYWFSLFYEFIDISYTKILKLYHIHIDPNKKKMVI